MEGRCREFLRQSDNLRAPSSIAAEIYCGRVGVSNINYIDKTKFNLPPVSIDECIC